MGVLAFGDSFFTRRGGAEERGGGGAVVLPLVGASSFVGGIDCLLGRLERGEAGREGG